jgi:diacylglycerol kinase (ATP)
MQPIQNQVLEKLFPKTRICFIVNPNAGVQHQKRIRESIEKHLDHTRFHYKIEETTHVGHGTDLAKKAAAEGWEIVVAVGGDGSVNEVAAGLLHTESALGIIPAGSGNGLAMHLGMGRNIDKAMQKINHSEVKLMDCGYLNGRPFVNMAGVGFDGLVSHLMRGKAKRGFYTYFFKSLEAGLTYVPRMCRIILDGKIIEEKCFTIAIANGPMYGYNFQIAPDAKLDDGHFEVVLLKDAPKWKYFVAVPETLSGRIYEADFVEHYSAKSVEIQMELPENFAHIDGEGIKVNGHLKFEMAANALKILVPLK